jgi:hypothetical protein
MEDANHGAGKPQGLGGESIDNPLTGRVDRPLDKGGRPEVKFDMLQLEKLCHINATQREIAAFFSCSVDTIQARIKNDPKFAETMERGYMGGRSSLRRKQMEVALEGNPTMLIWMGKQLLEQRDSLDTRHAGHDGGALLSQGVLEAWLRGAPNSD